MLPQIPGKALLLVLVAPMLSGLPTTRPTSPALHRDLGAASAVAAAPVSPVPLVSPSPAPAARPAERSTWVLRVPVFIQIFHLSCEAASLQMALAYYGDRVSQPALLALMKPDGTQPEMAGGAVVRWGDPYANFVGNPNGHEYNHTGYGAYFPVVARAAEEAGRRVIWSGTGLSWSDLTSAIRAGHPVVVWIGYDGSAYGSRGSLTRYQAWDGRQIPYAPGFEHAVTVSGITPTAVLVNNPYSGSQDWLGRSAFVEAISPFGNMAVVVG